MGPQPDVVLLARFQDDAQLQQFLACPPVAALLEVRRRSAWACAPVVGGTSVAQQGVPCSCGTCAPAAAGGAWLGLRCHARLPLRALQVHRPLLSSPHPLPLVCRATTACHCARCGAPRCSHSPATAAAARAWEGGYCDGTQRRLSGLVWGPDAVRAVPLVGHVMRAVSKRAGGAAGPWAEAGGSGGGGRGGAERGSHALCSRGQAAGVQPGYPAAHGRTCACADAEEERARWVFLPAARSRTVRHLQHTLQWLTADGVIPGCPSSAVCPVGG